MNPHFPNASQQFLDLNPQLSDSQLPEQERGARKETAVPAAVRPELERRDLNGAVGAGRAKGGDSKRFLVRVTSVRRRLIDQDNLAEKFVVDCCRYAGLIPGDGPGQTEIEVGQRKAEKGEEEHTVIEIFKL